MAARILVIDDDEAMRFMLREMLGRAGYEVVEAPNGSVGTKLFRESPTDLIITDMVMPEKDGMETIMELRTEFPDVKIIALSGGAKIGPYSYLMTAKRFGAEKTFTKPVKRVELLDAVRELLKAKK
ncbi:response regulator [Thermodesulfobacteriota bacterium]